MRAERRYGQASAASALFEFKFEELGEGGDLGSLVVFQEFGRSSLGLGLRWVERIGITELRAMARLRG